MGQILVSTNSNRLALTPRSGSHSLAAAWLTQFEPENYASWKLQPLLHPARFLAVQETPEEIPPAAPLACIVRDPVDRFRSMIAHRQLDVEQQLKSPMYAPLPILPYTHYFRFEDQLQGCAEWLGITIPLPHLDKTAEADKPKLTPEQETRVREIYAEDVALWESLQ